MRSVPPVSAAATAVGSRRPVPAMYQRNGIEGTHSELVRGYGLRQARYRGQAKVRLQNYFIGAACNIRRLFRRIVWETAHAGSAAETAATPAVQT